MYFSPLSVIVLVCLTSLSTINGSIFLQTFEPVNVVDKDFLSVTIDSSQLSEKFATGEVNILSDKILAMTKGLSPAYVRIGGTSGDFVIFSDVSEPKVQRTSRDVGLEGRGYLMGAHQLDVLHQFVNFSGWKMIFGLNQLLLTPEEIWDSSNAELFIKYCMQKGYNNFAFELGNEPDCYYEHQWPNLTGFQGAANAMSLRSLLNDLNYPGDLIAGPDVAVLTRINYLTQYLSAIGDTINATTWHHYYRNSEGATIPDFYSISMLDSLIDKIITLRQIVQNNSFSGDLWMGETSSTYGGGDAIYSSSFLSGFMWLDKLGLAAYDHKKVFRQTLIAAKYSLLSDTGDPYPDYWLSLLYKKLVGTRVLEVSDAFEYGRTVRIYAHCAKEPYPAGSVVFMILNIQENTTNIIVDDENLMNSSKDMYWLTPYQSESLTSQEVALNGVHLAVGGNNTLPELYPKEIDAQSDLVLPPLSFGYVVFKETKLKACL